MINYPHLVAAFSGTALAPWLATLPAQLARTLSSDKHGHLSQWLALLAQLPAMTAQQIELTSGTIKIGAATEIDAAVRHHIEALLRQLHPWRKGPFSIFGIEIDTEWRSDLKWDRLSQQIQPLHNRLVLDVGCGSGYHCWRMAGAGAKLVVGIEPTLLYNVQFLALRHFVPQSPIQLLPFTLEEIPTALHAFDTLFSMGVLYHRRSPFDHLLDLKEQLRDGGELVLETLVVDGPLGHVLVPPGRYAKMRNVWFIPSCLTLEAWLKRSGFNDVRLINVSTTTPLEQRTTDWMRFESLADFLSPHDASLTIEGLPAPQRALFLATKG